MQRIPSLPTAYLPWVDQPYPAPHIFLNPLFGLPGGLAGGLPMAHGCAGPHGPKGPQRPPRAPTCLLVYVLHVYVVVNAVGPGMVAWGPDRTPCPAAAVFLVSGHGGRCWEAGPCCTHSLPRPPCADRIMI